MFKPNQPKLPSNYEYIEDTLEQMTPDPRHFEGSVYPDSEVKKDLEQLNILKRTPEYLKSGARSDSKILEKTFIDAVERGDWFGEEESYSDDPDYLALSTAPTTEIDDVFNHIDLIAVINNEATQHETLPFAIDLTYNTDSDKMSQKFSWKHVWGKQEMAPEEVSEFGSSYADTDYSGQDLIKTKPLSLKFRRGLKIPGFASAKYYEDKNNPWNPVHPKGRIDLMPRFVVGYSTNIANTLATGLPNDAYREKYGEAAYQKQRKEYRNAEKRAKWCTLLECSEQAADIYSMLENMSSEETKDIQTAELEKTKQQIAAMNKYFDRAIRLAKRQAETDQEERGAMEDAKRDTVRQAIQFHSYNTYIGGIH